MNVLSLHKIMLLCCLCLSVGVLAAEGKPDALAAYPDCAAECIMDAFTQGICPPGDSECTCSKPEFKGAVGACVMKGCHIPDQLSTQNATMTACKAPVRDRSQKYATISNVMVTFAGTCVLIRFVFKLFVTKMSIGKDDYSVLLAFISTIPSAIVTVYGAVKNGLGKDIWTLTPGQINGVLKTFYTMSALYYLQVALMKLSIIAFYMRIFPQAGVQKVLWGTFVFVILWGIAYVGLSVGQCRPIHYFWHQWDGLHEGTCVGKQTLGWSNAAINITLDVWMLAVPLWQIRKLQLHWKKKIGVALMFVVGTFVTVVSILRLQSLVHLSSDSNVTWNFYDVSVWSSVEICVGIICMCLPTIRLALIRCFPILGGSSVRSNRQQYYEYGPNRSGHQSGRNGGVSTVGRSGNARTGHVTGIGTERRDSDQESGGSGGGGHQGAGIMFEKTYDVQFSDDEAKLVQMTVLDSKGKTVEPHEGV